METGAEMALTVPPRENPDPSNLCAVTAPRSPCLASLSPGRASELWKAPAHALALGSCHEVVIWEEPAFMPVCPLFLQPKFMAQHAPPSHAGKVVLPLPLPPKASRWPRPGHTGPQDPRLEGCAFGEFQGLQVSCYLGNSLEGELSRSGRLPLTPSVS